MKRRKMKRGWSDHAAYRHSEPPQGEFLHRDGPPVIMKRLWAALARLYWPRCVLFSPAVKRLMKEAAELRDPTEHYHAQPLDVSSSHDAISLCCRLLESLVCLLIIQSIKWRICLVWLFFLYPDLFHFSFPTAWMAKEDTKLYSDLIQSTFDSGLKYGLNPASTSNIFLCADALPAEIWF